VNSKSAATGPTAAEVAPVLAAFKRRAFRRTKLPERLADYGIADQDVKDLLLWQRTLLLFIEVRFQSGVQVTGQDIQDYFDKVVKPAAEAAHPGQPIDLEDYRDQIEQTITGQRADRQMDTWLQRGPQPHRDRVPRRGAPVTRRRIAWIAAGGLAALALIVVVAAILVLRSAWFYEQVRERCEHGGDRHRRPRRSRVVSVRLEAAAGPDRVVHHPRHGSPPASLRCSTPAPSPWV